MQVFVLFHSGGSIVPLGWIGCAIGVVHLCHSSGTPHVDLSFYDKLLEERWVM